MTALLKRIASWILGGEALLKECEQTFNSALPRSKRMTLLQRQASLVA